MAKETTRPEVGDENPIDPSCGSIASHIPPSRNYVARGVGGAAAVVIIGVLASLLQDSPKFPLDQDRAGKFVHLHNGMPDAVKQGILDGHVDKRREIFKNLPKNCPGRYGMEEASDASRWVIKRDHSVVRETAVRCGSTLWELEVDDGKAVFFADRSMVGLGHWRYPVNPAPVIANLEAGSSGTTVPSAAPAVNP